MAGPAHCLGLGPWAQVTVPGPQGRTRDGARRCADVHRLAPVYAYEAWYEPLQPHEVAMECGHVRGLVLEASGALRRLDELWERMRTDDDVR